MLSLLAAIALVLPQEPSPTAVPLPTTPEPRSRGIDLRSLAELVTRATGKEFVASDPLENVSVSLAPRLEKLGPDQLFGRFLAILQSAGYTAVKLPGENQHQILRIGAPISAPLAEYDDPERLPGTEEICALRMPLAALGGREAWNLVRMRLHPQLMSLSMAAADCVTLIDFAPTLRQVARVVRDADKGAAEASRPVELEFWLVRARQVADLAPVAPPEIAEAIKPELPAKAEVSLAGHGRVRVSPTHGSSAEGRVHLADEADISAKFGCRIERGRVWLSALRVGRSLDTGDRTRLYAEASAVMLTPGKLVPLSSWAGTHLLVRAFIRE